MNSIISRLKYFLNRADSYAQYGEDNIILLMIGLFNIEKPKYMDIGAHHPFKLNNTALLYKHGLTGINIEPDPLLFKAFLRDRKRDINLNIGIHEKKGKLIFYQFEKSEFNTFSKNAADQIEKHGIKKTGEASVEVATYNNVVEKYLMGVGPDILFCDAEGLDEIIIKSIDYKRFRPKIICIETYAYGVGIKNHNIIDFLISNHYSIHADTFVNTIFISKAPLSQNR